MFLLGFWYMRRSSFYRRFAIHRAWPRWSVQREILGLGIPMSISYALEATSFTAITLLAARLEGGTVPAPSAIVAAKPTPAAARHLLIETFGGPFSPPVSCRRHRMETVHGSFGSNSA